MDVKPGNIFADQAGGFWLADFDIVCRFNSVAPSTNVKVTSTPSFVPSDRRSRDGTYPVSTQHDWWMLAMTIVDMMTEPMDHKTGLAPTDTSCAQVKEALNKIGTLSAGKRACFQAQLSIVVHLPFDKKLLR